jgi:hypothetical protein
VPDIYREKIDAFTVMQEMCEKHGLDWQIVPNSLVSPKLPGRRQVMYYLRESAYVDVGAVALDWSHRGTSYDIDEITYDKRLRQIPLLQPGDVAELVTNLLFIGDAKTLPANVDYLIQSNLWINVGDVTTKYTILSVPYPPNPKPWIYSTNPDYWNYVDSSLVRDDDGHPALCFRLWGGSSFYNVMQHVLPERTGMFKLDADYRTWRRLKFKFRHATRDYTDTSTYTVRLHCSSATEQEDAPALEQSEWLDLNFEYQFGEGTQEAEGVSIHDTVDGNGWTEIDLLLPSFTKGGVLDDAHGWTQNYLLDGASMLLPTKVDFISFEITPSESEPGITYDGKQFLPPLQLKQAAPAGSIYLEIDDPDKYFQRGYGFSSSLSGEVVCDPKPSCYVGDGTFSTSELVHVDGVNGDYPGTYNVKLMKPLDNSYSSGDYLFIPSGRIYSISQLRLEKNIINDFDLTDELDSSLANPKRYRVIERSEVETGIDLLNIIRSELMRSKPKVMAKLTLDGDPRFKPGLDVDINLDQERADDGVSTFSDFHDNVVRLDDFQYVVDGVDFYMVFTLSDRNKFTRTYVMNFDEIQGAIQNRRLVDAATRNEGRFEEAT